MNNVPFLATLVLLYSEAPTDTKTAESALFANIRCSFFLMTGLLNTQLVGQCIGFFTKLLLLLFLLLLQLFLQL